MTIRVRRARASDARAIATIRVRSWRAAYAGLVDPVLLAVLDIEREARLRAARWDQRHADPRDVDLIAHRAGRAVGWAHVGPCRDEDLGGTARGELYALYVLPEHWSTGAGHTLMTVAEQVLRDCGWREASLWVLEGNVRAASFYERHGWREDGTVKDDDRIVGDTGAAPLRERRRLRLLCDAQPDRSTMPNASAPFGDGSG